MGLVSILRILKDFLSFFEVDIELIMIESFAQLVLKIVLVVLPEVLLVDLQL